MIEQKIIGGEFRIESDAIQNELKQCIVPEFSLGIKYSPCQGQSNLTPWKITTNHGRLQMPAIGG